MKACMLLLKSENCEEFPARTMMQNNMDNNCRYRTWCSGSSI